MRIFQILYLQWYCICKTFLFLDSFKNFDIRLKTKPKQNNNNNNRNQNKTNQNQTKPQNKATHIQQKKTPVL